MPCQILTKITNYWLSLEAILFHSCWPVFIYQVDWKGFLLQLIFLAIYISDQWLVFYMNPEIHLCVSSLLFFPGNEDFSSFGINCFLLWHCFLICIMCSKVRNNTMCQYVWGGRVAKWLGHCSCNQVVLGSSLLPCLSLDLFLVASSSTPLLHFVYSQLDCFLPIGNLEYFVYVCLQCLFTICLN